MKKELFASVLTLTAGMLGTVSFPQTTLAKSTLIESEFAKTFRLKSANPVRYTSQDGEVVMGHIYLELEQSPFTPYFNNRLHGEMTGTLFFESDELTEETYGVQHKTRVNLAGDEGDVLLDLTHTGQGHTYQVYGCNSTRTQCAADSYELSVLPGQKVEMSMKFAGYLGLEILETTNGNSLWTSEISAAAMVEVPAAE